MRKAESDAYKRTSWVKDEQELSALIMCEASIADITRFSTDPAGKATARKGSCDFVIS